MRAASTALLKNDHALISINDDVFSGDQEDKTELMMILMMMMMA